MIIKINFTKKHLVDLIAWLTWFFMISSMLFCVCNTIYWIATGDNIRLFGNERLSLAIAIFAAVCGLVLLKKLK